MKKSRKEIALEFANKINSKYIKQIILFGSVARGDDNQDSDIDLLIIVSSRKKVINLIEDTVADFAYKYHELISAHIISEDKYNWTKNYSFFNNINMEGVVLVWNKWLYPGKGYGSRYGISEHGIMVSYLIGIGMIIYKIISYFSIISNIFLE